jgi:hypothetical protein
MASMMIVCMLVASGTFAGTMPSQAINSGSVFYFHYKSQLYRSDNASITLLELANLSAPTGSNPQAIDVASAIRNATTIFGTIWVGTIGWITRPIAEPTAIDGSVNLQVWLSTTGNDGTPTFSGIGAGIAVLDQQNQTVGNYIYSYRFAAGSILTTDAQQYAFSVNFDRELAPGQRIVFAVGVGSTSLGWGMRVYFDATQYPSQVQLPTSVVVVSEFTQTPVIMATVAALIVFSVGLVQRRRGKERIMH